MHQCYQQLWWHALQLQTKVQEAKSTAGNNKYQHKRVRCKHLQRSLAHVRLFFLLDLHATKTDFSLGVFFPLSQALQHKQGVEWKPTMILIIWRVRRHPSCSDCLRVGQNPNPPKVIRSITVSPRPGQPRWLEINLCGCRS